MEEFLENVVDFLVWGFVVVMGVGSLWTVFKATSQSDNDDDYDY